MSSLSELQRRIDQLTARIAGLECGGMATELGHNEAASEAPYSLNEDASYYYVEASNTPQFFTPTTYPSVVVAKSYTGAMYVGWYLYYRPSPGISGAAAMEYWQFCGTNSAASPWVGINEANLGPGAVTYGCASDWYRILPVFVPLGYLYFNATAGTVTNTPYQADAILMLRQGMLSCHPGWPFLGWQWTGTATQLWWSPPLNGAVQNIDGEAVTGIGSLTVAASQTDVTVYLQPEGTPGAVMQLGLTPSGAEPEYPFAILSTDSQGKITRIHVQGFTTIGATPGYSGTITCTTATGSAEMNFTRGILISANVT